MAIAEQFLIATFADGQPWITEEWLRAHIPQLVRGLQRLGQGRCFVLVLGQEGIQSLAADDYFKAFDKSIEQDGGLEKLFGPMADELLDVLGKIQSEREQPKDN